MICAVYAAQIFLYHNHYGRKLCPCRNKFFSICHYLTNFKPVQRYNYPRIVRDRGSGWSMYYELYIDVFFLENFMADSILLCLINRILKCGQPFGRMIAGASAGSFLTCVLVASPLPGIIKMFLYHAAAGSVMIVLGLRIRAKAQFIKAYILLYVCAVFLGGMLGIFRPYMRMAGIFYAAAVLCGYLFLKLWKLIACLHREKSVLVPVSLYTEQGILETMALLDTGNCLRDLVSGDPVSVLAGETAVRLRERADHGGDSRMIACRTVGGETGMRVIRIRKMCIHMEEDKWIDHPLFGIAEDGISGDGSYSVILNPAVMME